MVMQQVVAARRALDACLSQVNDSKVIRIFVLAS